MWLEVGPKGNK